VTSAYGRPLLRRGVSGRLGALLPPGTCRAGGAATTVGSSSSGLIWLSRTALSCRSTVLTTLY
jgi:hypothetical protein